MPMPSRYEIMPDKDLVQPLERALQAPAGGVTREGSCFLVAANFIVVRPDHSLRLDI